MTISPEMIRQVWEEDWDQAKEEFGSAAAVPYSVSSNISEKYRAFHVLLAHPSENPVQTLKHFAVMPNVIELIANTYLGIEDIDVEGPIEIKPKLADKYRALDQWAFDHPCEQVTPDVLTEMSGLSYASVMKYLKDTPRYKKVKNGLYEAFEDQQKVL